jgi:hypothetical protein
MFYDRNVFYETEQFSKTTGKKITTWAVDKGQLISDCLFDVLIFQETNAKESYLFFQFNQFLDSRAEIHQIFALVFLENLRHQKVILKFTDL